MHIKSILQKLSFRTGVIVLSLCLPCYLMSFLQMALPISAAAKATLWVIFFGLAKCFQYGGLTILGAEGWRRLKHHIWTRRAHGKSHRNRQEPKNIIKHE